MSGAVVLHLRTSISSGVWRRCTSAANLAAAAWYSAGDALLNVSMSAATAFSKRGSVKPCMVKERSKSSVLMPPSARGLGVGAAGVAR